MAVAAVACPHCGQVIDAEFPPEGDVGGVRRRLKSQFRLTRNTCPKCGRQYDIRQR
ncbi:hypothetical protein SAMN04488063_2156 [Halopelagius inordinatus]|uniref:Uncharacterized protein n=1 Tax=Halopelagius inordinatus TaxID=553467 RepID=A0A1I2S2I3_9EURY|nr:hypothetical protein [Halopelagius inordinatus]SFG47125.1 hypothetical protein SAMN04488063_2156 [Halopelagius inordinatus]